MNLVLVAGTVVGAIANVLALWLAFRARRRRFARDLDREIREAVWEYARACDESGTPHSLSSFTPAELLSARADDPTSETIRTAALDFVRESLKWRLEYYRHSVPRWTLSLLPSADAYRYNLEWAAHLAELIDEGDYKQLKADRRRLAALAVSLAFVLRAHRSVRRLRAED